MLIILQFKPSLDKEKDPMAGIMDMMKVSTCSDVVDFLLLCNSFLIFNVYVMSDVSFCRTCMRTVMRK